MDERLLNERKKIVMDLISDPVYVPMKTKEMALLLNLPKNKRSQLQEVLDDLTASGKIEMTSGRRYRPASVSNREGIFLANRRGFGFVSVEGEEDDYFIPERYVHHAFAHDTVRILVHKGTNGHVREAEITQIIAHEITDVVGTYDKKAGTGIVICDDPKIPTDIKIPSGSDLNAADGAKVICHIDFYGDDNRSPEGTITEILGHKDDPGIDILSMIRTYQIPVEFPEDVLSDAAEKSRAIGRKELRGRRDLRYLSTITIDGEDSKDLDDAVSLTMEGSNYCLGVHIADVAHYVTENSQLDLEARRRGTSVYLVDRVIPMLPHTLCNDLCSLNEGEDRLTLSCLMVINPKGKVISHEICESVIHSHHRMTYTSVNRILEDHDPTERKKYADMGDAFDRMEELARILHKRRVKRGSIDFEFPESVISMDKDGHVKDVCAYHRGVANRMIEEFMLAANETVAEHFCRAKIPFLYRTHEKPDSDRIHTLAAFIKGFGYDLGCDPADVSPKDLQKLIAQIEGSSEENLISTLTLRSMQRARYTVDCKGHFGLAAKYYCHFTSPIRRYPDLQIHRIIKEVLTGKFNKKRKKHYESILPVIAMRMSKLERRADEIERDCDKMEKVNFLSDHIGEEFDGVISGVTKWGLYVELPNTCEGLVPIRMMSDDHYLYSEETYELIGEHNNRHFKLGSPLHILVAACDTEAHTADFAIADGTMTLSAEEKKPDFPAKKGGKKKSNKKKSDKKDNKKKASVQPKQKKTG